MMRLPALVCNRLPGLSRGIRRTSTAVIACAVASLLTTASASGISLSISPGIRGQVNQFSITDATPGGTVLVLYSISDDPDPNGYKVPGCERLIWFRIEHPRIAVRARANERGEFSFETHVPSERPSILTIQAFDHGQCSTSLPFLHWQ